MNITTSCIFNDATFGDIDIDCTNKVDEGYQISGIKRYCAFF